MKTIWTHGNKCIVVTCSLSISRLSFKSGRSSLFGEDIMIKEREIGYSRAYLGWVKAEKL